MLGTNVGRIIALLALLTLCVSGCDDGMGRTYQVSGTVSYQGKPLPLGTVTVVPETAPPGVAKIEPDGKFELRVAAGTHRVAVAAIPPMTGGRPDPNFEGGFDMTGVPVPKPLIPAKFNSYESSGITIEVQSSGENKIDIDLK